jgi:hypothetical protein
LNGQTMPVINEILTLGASYWARLAESLLEKV